MVTTFDPKQGFQSVDPSRINIGGKVIPAPPRSGGGGSSRRRNQQRAAQEAEQAKQNLLRDARLEEQNRLEQQVADSQIERKKQIDQGKQSVDPSRIRVTNPSRGERFRSEVQPFTPSSTIPLTRFEAGAEGVFAGIGRGVGRKTRFLLNEQTAEDFAAPSGFFIPLGVEQTLVRDIPSGTDIDPSSGIVQDLTIRERAERDFIVSGLGTPLEFERQRVKEEVISTARRGLETDREQLQTAIDKGQISFEAGQEALEMRRERAEGIAQEDFSKEFDKVLIRRGAGETSLQSLKSARESDVRQIVEIGAIGAGLVLAPAIAPGAILVGGTAKIFSAGARPGEVKEIEGILGDIPLTTGKIATGEKASTALSGALDVGIGFAAFAPGVRGSVLGARAEGRAAQAIESGFKRGELGETFFKAPRGGIGVGGGVQRRVIQGDIVETGFRSTTPTLRQGDFVGGVTKGTRTVKVKVAGTDIEGILAKGQTFEVTEGFGAVGISRTFPTGQKDTTGFVGRTGEVSGRRVKDPQFVSGFSRKTGKNLFETQSSTTFFIQSGRKNLVNIGLKNPDVGITRVRDITGIESTVGISGRRTTGRLGKDLTKRFRGQSQLQTQQTKQLGTDFLGQGLGTQISTRTLQQKPIKFSGGSARLTSPAAFQGIDLGSQRGRQAFQDQSFITGSIKPPRAGGLGTGLTDLETSFVTPITSTRLRPPEVISTSRPRTRGIPKTTLTTKTLAKPFQDTFTGQGVGLDETTLEAPKLKTKLLTGFDEGFVDTPPPRTTTRFRPRPGFDRFGFLPPFQLPSGIADPELGRAKPSKRKFKRAPSFAGAELGITASKPAPLEFTGLTLRPIIKKRKKK